MELRTKMYEVEFSPSNIGTTAKIAAEVTDVPCAKNTPKAS